MRVRTVAKRLGSAWACAALGLSLLVSGAAAQGYGPTTSPGASTQVGGQAGPSSGAFVVRIESNISPNGVAGNLTLNGVAVDCSTGRAATRVAIYDGVDGPYVADASIDTQKNVSSYCAGPFGSGQIGWSLIYDTHRLDNGRHMLAFTAEFPGGSKATTTAAVYVDNNPYQADNSQYNYYDYFGFYGVPYGYGGYYGGYYGGGYGGCGYYGYGCGSAYVNYPYSFSPYYGGYGIGGYNYGPARSPYTGYGYYVYPRVNYYGYYPYYGGLDPFAYFGNRYSGYSIILYQAGQTVQRNAASSLAGIVACGLPGTTTVAVQDITAGGVSVLIGTQATTSNFAVNWNTSSISGTRLIQVSASGPCGSQSQTFNVTVA